MLDAFKLRLGKGTLNELPQDAGIQDVFRHLANDAERTEKIVAETLNAFNLGRKVLVLTERTEHLDIISNTLAERVPVYFALHGRMSKNNVRRPFQNWRL